MRKNLKNNIAAKVTATILATMVAFSSIPAQVFANEMSDAKEAVEAAEASSEVLETISEGNADAGIEAASKEDGGAIAQESVETFVETVENSDTAETVNEAANELAEAEKELEKVAEADNKANEKSAEMVSDVASATEIANEATQTVEDTQAKAEDLTKVITNEDATAEQISEAFEKLDTITDDAAEVVEAKKEAFDVISDKFEEAKKELIAAQKAYEDSVKGLKSDDGNVAKAAKKLEEAKQDVETLSNVYETAKADLEKEKTLVDDINKRKEISDKNTDWKTQNALMKSIMTGYIIPNLIDKDATNISYSSETQRGFDRQNSSYCKVTYTDKEGNVVTRYFNIDRTDRQFKANDQWYRLGSSREIIIYEKPEEDITSSQYQISHFGDLGKKGVTSEFKAAVNAGTYDVYAFDYADGTKEYKCIDEIEAAVVSGEITVKDGVYYMNGTAARKVVQTTSGNATGIRVSTKDDEGLIAYIENAAKLVEKYEKYGESIATAKEKIDEASDKVEALKDVIEVIEDDKDRVANVVDGLKAYLSEEDFAKLQNAGSDEKAVEILEGILSGAKKDLEKASTQLTEIITQREEIRKQINDKKAEALITETVETAVTVEEKKEEVKEETATKAVAPAAPVAEEASVAVVTAAPADTVKPAEKNSTANSRIGFGGNEVDDDDEVITAEAAAVTAAPAVVPNVAVGTAGNIVTTEVTERETKDMAGENEGEAVTAQTIEAALEYITNTMMTANLTADNSGAPVNANTAAGAAAGTSNLWWIALSIAVLQVLRMIKPMFI